MPIFNNLYIYIYKTIVIVLYPWKQIMFFWSFFEQKVHPDIRKCPEHRVLDIHTHTHLHTNAYTLTDSKPTIQSKVSNSDFRSTSQLVEKAVPTWLPTEKQNNKELFSSTFRAQRPPCLQLHNKQAEYWPGLLSVCVCVYRLNDAHILSGTRPVRKIA